MKREKLPVVTKRMKDYSFEAIIPNMETMTLERKEITGALCPEYNGSVGIQNVKEREILVSMDTMFFIVYAHSIIDTTSRAGLVTRTIPICRAKAISIDIETMTMEAREIVFDARMSDEKACEYFDVHKIIREKVEDILYAMPIKAFYNYGIKTPVLS